MNTDRIIATVQEAQGLLDCNCGIKCKGECTKSDLAKVLDSLRISVVMEKETLTERGNIFLVGPEGEIYIACRIEPVSEKSKETIWLEITVNEDNYPAVSVRFIQLTDRQLGEFIRDNKAGWTAKKLNLNGFDLDLDHNSTIIGEPK